MSTDLVLVPVPGTDAPMQASLVDGEPYVALKPMCEAIGIDSDTQRRKLDQAEWACTVTMTAHDSSGRVQQMFGLHADSIPMWLATIAVNRVAEHARPILIAYQKEAAKALRDYFYRGVAVAGAVNQFDALRAMIDQLETVERNATEAKALAERTEARLDAIEGKHDWFSAVAYARLNGLPTNTTYLRRIGSCASRIGRNKGVEPTQVQHQLYGWVNSWPAWLWDLAAEGFELP